jgi:membrane protein YdbS with pleckstrin-like domain
LAFLNHAEQLSMKCPVCDAKVPDAATFCQQCGAKLPSATTAVESPAGRTGELADNPAATAALVSAQASNAPRRGVVDTPEETIWEGSYSPKAMLGVAVLAAIGSLVLIVAIFLVTAGWIKVTLFVALLLLWVLVAGRLAQRRLGISYKLTNHMFYHRHGVLTRVTDRIELIEVHDVTYEQGLFERMVDVGSIKIASSDRTDPIFYLRGVESVEQVAQSIDKARRNEQVRRGRRIDFSHIDGST